MKCINCGAELNEGMALCPTCGAAQNAGNESPMNNQQPYYGNGNTYQPQQQQPYQQQPYQPQQQYQGWANNAQSMVGVPQEKKSVPLIIWLVADILTIINCVAYFVYANFFK